MENRNEVPGKSYTGLTSSHVLNAFRFWLASFRSSLQARQRVQEPRAFGCTEGNTTTAVDSQTCHRAPSRARWRAKGIPWYFVTQPASGDKWPLRRRPTGGVAVGVHGGIPAQQAGKIVVGALFLVGKRNGATRGPPRSRGTNAFQQSVRLATLTRAPIRAPLFSLEEEK